MSDLDNLIRDLRCDDGHALLRARAAEAATALEDVITTAKVNYGLYKSASEDLTAADAKIAEFRKLARIYLDSSDAERWPQLAEKLRLAVGDDQ